MEIRLLGHSGIAVSAFGLGTMMFGAWGNLDEAACRTMVELALDAGVTLFDTADVYDQGRSEEILGRAIGRRRDRVVVATKFGFPMGEDPAHAGNSRRWVTAAVDGSLRRLGTEWIDLYQIHRPDPAVPIAETLGALDDLVLAGKIRAIGTSTFPADELVDTQWTAKSAGLVRPTAEQPPYSIFTRRIEDDVLPACAHHEIAGIVWAPLNGGWLTGKYRAGVTAPAGSRAANFAEHIDVGGPFHAEKARLVDELEVVADAVGCPLSALALAFAVEHPVVSSVLLGPKTPEQLTELLAATDRRLDTDVLDAIDRIVAPGRDVNPADGGFVRPELSPERRRRGPATH